MDLISKIEKLLIGDETGATLTGNVATNTAKGHIDVIGMSYRRKKKKNRLGTETIVHEEEHCPEGERW